ncbi:MAG: metal-binding protein [Bacteroidetes bacterium]|nr:metal-binding protein [Bacteroidota bacterium]
MIRHSDFENNDEEKKRLHQLIRQQKILFAGNKSLRIFGKLSCTSGKRMKKWNRVFFESEKEAIALGYRPCGHCMREEYLAWKA